MLKNLPAIIFSFSNFGKDICPDPDSELCQGQPNRDVDPACVEFRVLNNNCDQF